MGAGHFGLELQELKIFGVNEQILKSLLYQN